MRRFWPRFVSERAGLAAAAYVLVLTLVMLALEVMPGSDPHAITSEVMLPPSAAHVLGTDELGRDVLLGILHGIRVSLTVGFAAALGATLIGVLVGAVAAFYGGILDLLCMRLSELFQVVPSFILARGDRRTFGPRPAPGRGRDRAARLAAGGPAHARRGDAHQASSGIASVHGAMTSPQRGANAQPTPI